MMAVTINTTATIETKMLSGKTITPVKTSVMKKAAINNLSNLSFRPTFFFIKKYFTFCKVFNRKAKSNEFYFPVL